MIYPVAAEENGMEQSRRLRGLFWTKKDGTNVLLFVPGGQ
jgi:hypothetical protein